MKKNQSGEKELLERRRYQYEAKDPKRVSVITRMFNPQEEGQKPQHLHLCISSNNSSSGSSGSSSSQKTSGSVSNKKKKSGQNINGSSSSNYNNYDKVDDIYDLVYRCCKNMTEY